MKSSLIKDIFFTEILKGMALTFKTLFKPAVTRRYPLVRVPSKPGFRGLHALAKDNTGRMKCVGCGLCEDACPSASIKVDEIAVVDAKTCTSCGTCADECPNDAIIVDK